MAVAQCQAFITKRSSEANYTQSHEHRFGNCAVRVRHITLLPYGENADFSTKCVISRDSCVLSKIYKGENFFSIKFYFQSLYFHNFCTDPLALFSLFPKVRQRKSLGICLSWRIFGNDENKASALA